MAHKSEKKVIVYSLGIGFLLLILGIVLDVSSFWGTFFATIGIVFLIYPYYYNYKINQKEKK